MSNTGDDELSLTLPTTAGGIWINPLQLLFFHNHHNNKVYSLLDPRITSLCALKGGPRGQHLTAPHLAFNPLRHLQAVYDVVLLEMRRIVQGAPRLGHFHSGMLVMNGAILAPSAYSLSTVATTGELSLATRILAYLHGHRSHIPRSRDCRHWADRNKLWRFKKLFLLLSKIRSASEGQKVDYAVLLRVRV